MKPFTIILVLFFCLNSVVFSQEIIIKGKIINPISNSVQVAFSDNSGDYETISIPLDSSSHTFEFRHKLNDIAYISFRHFSFTNGQYIELILHDLLVEPDDEVALLFDSKDFWNSLKFEGKSAKKFNYFREDYLKTKIKTDWEQTLTRYSSKPVKEYFASIEQIIADRLAILKKYQHEVSSVFYKIREADIKAIVGTKRLSALYDASIQDFKPIQALPYELQTTFFKDLPNQNDTTVKAKHFFIYITTLYYTYLSEFNQLARNTELTGQVSVVRQNQVYFHPSFAEKLSSAVILKDLEKHGINPTYQKNIAEFRELYPTSASLLAIEKQEQNQKNFVVGQPAMPFKVSDTTGKEMSLDDFKGKVIYLDFWASWCTPCIVDIEHAKKIKEHFKDRDDIVFLYISVDQNKDAWKKAIDKYEISGVHGLANADDPI